MKVQLLHDRVARIFKVYEERGDNGGMIWYRIGKNQWGHFYNTNKAKGPNNSARCKR